MRTIAKWAILVFAFVSFSALPVLSQDNPPEKSNLKVLYAGVSGSDREKEFTSFLAKHFIIVKSDKYNTLSENLIKEYDVVVVDCTNADFKVKIPSFLYTTKKPVMLMSFQAGEIIYEQGGKESKKGGYM